MTDAEILLASTEKLAEDRRALSGAETTPAEITPVIHSFAVTLGGLPPLEVPVVEDEHGRYGWCSDGVRLKVAACNGQPVYGWTIWDWGAALLTAEFHCVWRSPTGDLVDITPKPGREKTIVFVETPSYPPDFNFDNRPRNRRLRIYEPANRTQLIDAIAARLTDGQRAYEQRRADKAGLSLQAWLGRKVPVDRLPDAIDELIEVCSQFEEHFDSLGSSGFVQVDRKLVDLQLKRIEVQARCKALLGDIGRG